MEPIDNYNKSKIKRVRVLFLDKAGYGPKGLFTRKKWREECLKNFLAGKENFKRWQLSWIDSEINSSSTVDFATWVRFEDGTRTNAAIQMGKRCTLDFAGYIFTEDIVANKFEFLIDVCFSGCTFPKYTNFTESIFSGVASFWDTRFNYHSNFSVCKFTQDARFDNAQFDGYLNFECSLFEASADFNDVVFKGYAGYKRATFESDTEFNSAKFCYLAEFKSANFNWDAEFESAIFLNDTSFFKSIFKDTVNFVSAVFAADVNFEDCIFENVGHFQDTKFTTKVPCFLGVSMTSRLEFSDESYFSNLDITAKGIANLRVLKRLSDEHGLTDHAINFNAMELRAKRLQIEPKAATWTFKVVTWLYEILSDYGRSFGRPILTYLGLVTITYLIALIAAANNSPQACKGELWRIFQDMRDNGSPSCLSAELPEDKLKLNGYRAAFEYTTYRAAGILDFSDNDKQTVAVSRRLFNADVEPTWMRIWGVFKAIASAALLFLAALGLRNKYRIK